MFAKREMVLLIVVIALLVGCGTPIPVTSTATRTVTIAPTLTHTRAPNATKPPTATSTIIPTVTPIPTSTNASVVISGVTPVSRPSLSALPNIFPKIDRKPAPSTSGQDMLLSLPAYKPDSDQWQQVNLQSYDLSRLDLRQSLNDLMYADFDTLTRWPSKEKMPRDFDWQRILELGKNPGLGIRQLHALGITGYGVGIAIIDQPLLVDHQEYEGQLRLYEETDDVPRGTKAAMHGSAVASIAVGKTVGVAPDADLYYIAWAYCQNHGGNLTDFTCLAQNVRHVLAINQQLPADRKIRVISLSIGWRPGDKGYDDITAAAQEAKASGLLVIYSSSKDVNGFKFDGLGRSPLAEPDNPDSYEHKLWEAKQFYEHPLSPDCLLVPMDSRTTASNVGINDYAFYREGGPSWSIPYIAGLYALATQVKPSITPDEFWFLATQTGRIIQLKHNGTTIPFGPIVDPVALIHKLQSQQQRK